MRPATLVLYCPHCNVLFIDPEGYRAYIDAAEAELHSGRLHLVNPVASGNG
ncbi:MAG: hypothetical protein AB7O65_09620 [Candidatus Korobacteraceae bacterium]